MQQKLKTEEVAIMDNNSRPFYKPISLADDPKVQRARKVLIIILGVFCVSILILFQKYLFMKIISYHYEYRIF